MGRTALTMYSVRDRNILFHSSCVDALSIASILLLNLWYALSHRPLTLTCSIQRTLCHIPLLPSVLVHAETSTHVDIDCAFFLPTDLRIDWRRFLRTLTQHKAVVYARKLLVGHRTIPCLEQQLVGRSCPCVKYYFPSMDPVHPH